MLQGLLWFCGFCKRRLLRGAFTLVDFDFEKRRKVWRGYVLLKLTDNRLKFHSVHTMITEIIVLRSVVIFRSAPRRSIKEILMTRR